MSQDTIAAVSTANGRGGVAIVRVSGEDALAVAEKMFLPVGKIPVKDFVPYTMYPGKILAERFTDFGLCVFFRAPASYTGENVVEFHCHGGTEIARGILKNTFLHGARPAEAGEFTRRAFLNGKMSLAGAEGVADMINADSESMIRAGYSLLNNELGKEIAAVQNRITTLLAGIEADIDYPEEGLDESIPDLVHIREQIGALRGVLDGLCRSYETVGKNVKSGVSVAIVGRPNSGKSSLLNAILGKNKAIVSDIEGTTRDIVEGEIYLNGFRFCLYDTAGIRESRDVIERIGVERAENILEEADVVLHVTDASEPPHKTDEDILRRGRERKRSLYLVVLNKSDLPARQREGEGLWKGEECVCVSARGGVGVEEIRKRLSRVAEEEYRIDGVSVVEERHYRALCKARDILTEAEKNCGGVPLDLLSIDLSSAWQSLGEITGETANEEIISEIFSKFCVGK